MFPICDHPRNADYYFWSQQQACSFPPNVKPKRPVKVEKKRGSVRNRWSNKQTDLRASEIARTFLVSAPVPNKDIALKALGLFKKDPGASKGLLKHYAPAEFGCSVDYLLWAQFKALFMKSSDGGTQQMRDESALRTFRASEERCRRTNRRHAWFRKYPNREPEMMRVVLSRAKELISDTLGNFTDDVLEQILDLARPGKGTAIGTKDPRWTSASAKLLPHLTEMSVTSRALPYARRLVEQSPAWLTLCFDPVVKDGRWVGYTVPYSITEYNRVSFVPKDAGTSRTIAIEPALNMWLQLGVHEYFLRRLRAVGVDIRSQSRNQRLARKGAAEWLTMDPLCTIDLSAASDSLSRELVFRLLPSTWAGFLDDIRSASFKVGEGGAQEDYAKWSSMGNGYTFVLETLIFWALAKACASMVEGPGTVAVYGDDIITNRSSAALLIEVLRWCGFSTNSDKTFLFGPFRESCGEDFFGRDRVVPVYIRETAKLRPTDIYRVANKLRRIGIDTPEVLDVLKAAHGRQGSPLLRGPWGPDTDAEWWCEDDISRFSATVCRGPDGDTWCCFAKYSSTSVRVDDVVAYTASLLGTRWDGDIEWKQANRADGRWTVGIRKAG